MMLDEYLTAVGGDLGSHPLPVPQGGWYCSA
jgi:hypothetical protein